MDTINYINQKGRYQYETKRTAMFIIVLSACGTLDGQLESRQSAAPPTDTITVPPVSVAPDMPQAMDAADLAAEEPKTSVAPTEEGNIKVDNSEDYEFTVNGDNTVTITKYTGSDGDIKIPAELDSKIVTAIGNTFGDTGAFQDCTTLTSVMIPNGITEIQDNAFQGCTNLVTVIIPKSMLILRNCAFDDCPNLRSVYFEGDVPDTGNYVFTASSNPTLYYHEGASGWTNPFYGCTAKTY